MLVKCTTNSTTRTLFEILHKNILNKLSIFFFRNIVGGGAKIIPCMGYLIIAIYYYLYSKSNIHKMLRRLYHTHIIQHKANNIAHSNDKTLKMTNLK